MNSEEFKKMAVERYYKYKLEAKEKYERREQEIYNNAYQYLKEIFPLLNKAENRKFELCGDYFDFKPHGNEFGTGKPCWALTFKRRSSTDPDVVTISDLSSYGEWIVKNANQ